VRGSKTIGYRHCDPVVTTTSARDN
jgi:hypothetical protein